MSFLLQTFIPILTPTLTVLLLLSPTSSPTLLATLPAIPSYHNILLKYKQYYNYSIFYNNTTNSANNFVTTLDTNIVTKTFFQNFLCIILSNGQKNIKTSVYVLYNCSQKSTFRYFLEVL